MDRCYGELKTLQVVRNRFQVSFPVDFLMAIESNQGAELKNQGAEETKEQRVENSRVEQEMSDACDYAFVVEKRSYRNDLVDDSDTGDSVTISLLFTNGMIDGYIELKREEVEMLNMTTHPVEFKMYYSV